MVDIPNLCNLYSNFSIFATFVVKNCAIKVTKSSHSISSNNTPSQQWILNSKYRFIVLLLLNNSDTLFFHQKCAVFGMALYVFRVIVIFHTAHVETFSESGCSFSGACFLSWIHPLFTDQQNPRHVIVLRVSLIAFWFTNRLYYAISYESVKCTHFFVIWFRYDFCPHNSLFWARLNTYP